VIGYGFHPEASVDLDEIWEFIADDNPDAADRTTEEILTAMRLWWPSPIKATGGRTSPPGPCGSSW
jgi:plasmid stabilization system protein ParE